MRPIRKVLTFRASSIGDCLMGKYLLENIHVAYPEARCGIVVGSRASMIRDLFVAYPWLEIIEANRRSPASLVALFKNFYGSDLVVTQYAGKAGGKFSFASKIAARILTKKNGLIGFSDTSRFNGILYDTIIPFVPSTAPAELEREALRAARIPVMFEHPIMQYRPMSDILTKFGLESGNYIIVHLFAGSTGRGLHPDRKRELLVALAQKLPHTQLVISGSVADKEEARHVSENIPAVIIAGEASLQELMNLIMHSHVVVSVDTGVAHITAQLGKPLIVLATCLGLHWWGNEQYSKDALVTIFTCAGLCAGGHNAKPYPDCINEIDLETVACNSRVILMVE
ncbi:MAG: glycosyltransferase family 9 protein [bacterium]|nr:glycosyltransferase family 9 protein [bacterium]